MVRTHDEKHTPHQSNLRRRPQRRWKDDIKECTKLECNELNMKVKDRVEWKRPQWEMKSVEMANTFNNDIYSHPPTIHTCHHVVECELLPVGDVSLGEQGDAG